MTFNAQITYAGLPRLIASFVFVFMAMAPPLAVWYLESQRSAQSLETEARVMAVIVSRVIARNPEYWNLTPERMSFVIRDVMPQGRRLLITDKAHGTVLALGVEPQAPAISSSQRLFDRDEAVGTLTLHGTLREVMVDAAMTAIVSLAVSFCITILLWRRVLLVIREAALSVQESRERFQRLTELSNDGYWTMDEQLRFTALSGGMERIGLGMDAAGGRRLSDIPFSGKPESLTRISEAVSARTVFLHEPLCLDIAGQKHWILLSGEPLFDHTGAYLGYHGTATDVSERIRMQDALVQSEKLASVGQLAAGMAHEINNPLGGILQSVQVIQRRLDPQRQPNRDAALETGCDLSSVREYLTQRRILEMLDNIDSSGRKAAQIVANLLEFSRKSSEHRRREDLLRIMDDAVDACGAWCRQNGGDMQRDVEIVKDYRGEALVVLGSKLELEQVLVSIMKNAVQAMRGKTYAQGRPRLTLRAFKRDGSAFLEIEDNGPGMDMAVRKHVFDPFFTTKRPGEGTGLGLSVAYYIITNHEGGMAVESTPGVGTTFTVRIPLSQQ
ncbi:MAG: two-component system sensor histidine kinase NtrB [Acidobacteriota bacterium]